MTLVFDTETTGKAEFSLPPEHPAQPRFVQLGALLFDDDWRVRAELNLISRLEEHPVEPGAQAIHGISREDSNRFGVPEKLIVGTFANLMGNAKTVDAHNIVFDKLIIDAAYARYGQKPVWPAEFCTMTQMTPICKLPSTRPGQAYKWPKLEEAYWYAFQEKITDAHDAMADVRACARLYRWLTKPSEEIDKPLDAVGSVPVSGKDHTGQVNKYEPAWTDENIMPWGKYKGARMADVPASYLGWMWSTGITKMELKNYVWNSRNALNEEIANPDHRILKY